jgi:RNA polymerase sigma-70 factor (ECF subfamily)
VTVESLRPLLFSIAYRMVGSVSEAEDLVQEALLRHHRAVADGEEIESPKAWLAAVTTRLGIDHLRSARARREEYVGTWLPEPLVAGHAPDAAEHAETADSLSMALLVLLERLSPVERAVFLLRDAFDYDYPEIAEIVGKSPDNTRQIAVRARRRVEEGKPRFEASRAERDALAERFFAAAREGDTEGLVALLAGDVVFYGDGGGKAPAAARPIHGPEQVGRFLANLGRLARRRGFELRTAEVNGQPGALALDAEGRVISVMTIDIADGRVQAIRSVVNPEKLGHLGEVADLRALLRGA